MTKLFYPTLLILALSGRVSAQDDIIFLRIETIYKTRIPIMEEVWPGVTDPVFNIPFLYYTDSASYVINPPQGFVEKFQPILRYDTPELKIYKTNLRLDSIPFHMEVHISSEPTDYNYEVPFGKISGFEETQRILPDLSPAQWIGMVLHEFFHGFQYRHTKFLNHTTNNHLVASAINDTLQSFYSTYAWYKEGIDQENAAIIKAIDEENPDTIKEWITSDNQIPRNGSRDIPSLRE